MSRPKRSRSASSRERQAAHVDRYVDSMPRMHTALLVVLILSGVLVAGGVVLVAVSSQTPASFGWFAYQPMSDSLFVPGGFVVLTQPAIVGVVVTGVGVVGLSAATGFMVGRRVRAGGEVIPRTGFARRTIPDHIPQRQNGAPSASFLMVKSLRRASIHPRSLPRYPHRAEATRVQGGESEAVRAVGPHPNDETHGWFGRGRPRLD